MYIDAVVERYLRGIDRLSAVSGVDLSRPLVSGGSPSSDDRLALLVAHGRSGALLSGLTDEEARALALTVCGRALTQPPMGTDPDRGALAGALTQGEIAAYMGISVSTLARVLRRARRKVAENLT